jgi:DMSO/TMAO reductase YedYZ molybdopterin-dependent catalytic subunit
MSPVTRGFHGKRRDAPADRVPPGQYVTEGFPVLSAGPTPHTKQQDWTFTIRQGGARLMSWTWSELQAEPVEQVSADIHCVTRWSKLDTHWQAVSIDTLLAQVQHDAKYVMAFCDGGYTTNLPVADVTGGQAWLAFGYGDGPLAPEHGGPVRLLVPHLYFWKSAKWVRGLDLLDHDRPGFWETYGYNMYGDPWKEQRYAGD